MAVNEGKQLKYFQLMEDLKEKILSGVWNQQADGS